MEPKIIHWTLRDGGDGSEYPQARPGYNADELPQGIWERLTGCTCWGRDDNDQEFAAYHDRETAVASYTAAADELAYGASQNMHWYLPVGHPDHEGRPAGRALPAQMSAKE